ncbi:MAG: bifunctional acetate--CoA ligase family protein/GNAT family N-acetyltransferase [Betaproteobacteria bacterium]|nr:bifunctional acetate--CoA ligase family protein/GNAT family N-acetyltransferase [Betaproteobacteria bacterium]
MEKHYLTPLFSPRSVAVIGATEREGSAGRLVFENLLASGYSGERYAVNPNHRTILGFPAFASVGDIEKPVDLAVIITPARTVPGIVEQCGRKGVRAAIIISAGFTDGGPGSASLLRSVLASARARRVRILGPNCLGLMRPVAGINFTYSLVGAKPGSIALISQSAALTNAVLDWAHANDIGFSNAITLGDGADINFGDVLDYLVWDSETESIVLYMEGVYVPRQFVSALRAAARVKPVVVVKAGRDPAGAKAALTHSGAMVGADEVFDSVLRRAGAVRVKTATQLFSVARCLTSRYRSTGKRLAIVTNGGGPGIIAADWAADVRLEVPELSAETIVRLEPLLSPKWSRGNPVDLCGQATPEQYGNAIAACMEDRNVDGVLVILTPQATTHSEEVARTAIEVAAKYSKPLLACWMGEARVVSSRQLLTQAKIPVFRTPEPAVDAFAEMAAHAENQRMLLQVPHAISHGTAPDSAGARLLIESILAEKRRVLNEMESKALLAAFHIPVANTVVAHSVSEAIMIAEQIGFPVAMKVNSPQVIHKSDVGGVRLNVNSAQEVRAAYNEILAAVAKHQPGAAIEGISIQPMTRKPHGRELMVGITTDAVFGPVITFGAGGIAVEVMGDRAVALPPLNQFIVQDLIGRTRVARTLGAFRYMPPVNMEVLESLLLRVSEMASELPWIRELDINPLIVDEDGAVAVDARVVVDHPPLSLAGRYGHMAIHPYPTDLVREWTLSDGTAITLRPIRPEDAEMHQEFIRNLSDESKYFRFISTMHELSQKALVRYTQIDYDREMALLAVVREGGRDVELGVSRYVINPDGESCEFALVVADAWHGRGVGSRLMRALMDVARGKGLKTIEGDVLNTNHTMLKLMTALGFALNNSEDDPSMKRVVKAL